MRKNLFRIRHGEVRVNAAALDTRDMISQMALPLIAQRRVKGALDFIARDTGVSYSKLRKIYYALTEHILHVEWNAIEAAHARWLVKQEQKLEHELATLRARQSARLQRGLNLDNPKNDPRAVHARTDVDTKQA